jgi:hypothetical protein
LRWGSDLNYFIEFAAAISILSDSGIDIMLAASVSLSSLWQAGIGVALAVILALPAVAAKSWRCVRYPVWIGLPAESCDTGRSPETFRLLV